MRVSCRFHNTSDNTSRTYLILVYDTAKMVGFLCIGPLHACIICGTTLPYSSVSQPFLPRDPKCRTIIWARPQPLNTPTSVLYVGEFGQHFSVRISFFKKLVDRRATPRKSLGDPKWGRDPEVEKPCPTIAIHAWGKCARVSHSLTHSDQPWNSIMHPQVLHMSP